MRTGLIHFNLEIVARFGKRLSVEWIARNPGEVSYEYTGALHPYFNVSDIRSIRILGLNGVDYLDKTEDFHRNTQRNELAITGWTDRIYLDTDSDVVIEDPGFNRSLRIHKFGSRTTVVWNPDYTAAEMPDVGAGQETGFVCVEAANAVNDRVIVPPGGECHLGMEIEHAA